LKIQFVSHQEHFVLALRKGNDEFLFTIYCSDINIIYKR